MHIMDEGQVNLPIPTCMNVQADIAKSSRIIEEGPRICPLCNSIVRLFYINFDEKILMCENVECEFPFGHEQVQIAKAINEFSLNEEVTSIRSSQSSTTSASVVSAAEWSEIERINRVYDSEDTQSELRAFASYNTGHIFKCKETEEEKINKEKDEKLKQNVKSIKGLSKIIQATEDQDHVLHNEKWIKELLDMQKTSGQRLVSNLELNKLKKKDPRIGLGELKIDIDNESPISSIKIQITKNP